MEKPVFDSSHENLAVTDSWGMELNCTLQPVPTSFALPFSQCDPSYIPVKDIIFFSKLYI